MDTGAYMAGYMNKEAGTLPGGPVLGKAGKVVSNLIGGVKKLPGEVKGAFSFKTLDDANAARAANAGKLNLYNTTAAGSPGGEITGDTAARIKGLEADIPKLNSAVRNAKIKTGAAYGGAGLGVGTAGGYAMGGRNTIPKETGISGFVQKHPMGTIAAIVALLFGMGLLAAK